MRPDRDTLLVGVGMVAGLVMGIAIGQMATPLFGDTSLSMTLGAVAGLGIGLLAGLLTRS